MTIDETKLGEFMNRFVGDLGAVLHAPLIVLGEKLGLYRALATKGLLVRFAEVRREGTRIHARVVVRNQLIGHLFPAMETSQRIGWVELVALSKTGEVLALVSKN